MSVTCSTTRQTHTLDPSLVKIFAFCDAEQLFINVRVCKAWEQAAISYKFDQLILSPSQKAFVGTNEWNTRWKNEVEESVKTEINLHSLNLDDVAEVPFEFKKKLVLKGWKVALIPREVKNKLKERLHYRELAASSYWVAVNPEPIKTNRVYESTVSVQTGDKEYKLLRFSFDTHEDSCPERERREKKKFPKMDEIFVLFQLQLIFPKEKNIISLGLVNNVLAKFVSWAPPTVDLGVSVFCPPSETYSETGPKDYTYELHSSEENRDFPSCSNKPQQEAEIPAHELAKMYKRFPR